MVVTVTRLYSLQPILLSEGDLKWRLTLADIVVSVHSLNDFVGIRRYVLQVVDLSFTHLDTYCYSLCTVLVVLLRFERLIFQPVALTSSSVARR